jgi:hypothetical protein
MLGFFFDCYESVFNNFWFLSANPSSDSDLPSNNLYWLVITHDTLTTEYAMCYKKSIK